MKSIKDTKDIKSIIYTLFLLYTEKKWPLQLHLMRKKKESLISLRKYLAQKIKRKLSKKLLGNLKKLQLLKKNLINFLLIKKEGEIICLMRIIKL